MPTRGIRGATSVMTDHPEAITSATLELLQVILEVNPELETEELASVLFTVTDDLSSTYPAVAARQLGWSKVPLLCAREIPVPGSLPRCIRVLLHWNTSRSQAEINHVYLRDAITLRPDLAADISTDQ